MCLTCVLGKKERSGAAEAAAAQQEEPEADLPVKAAAAAAAGQLAPNQYTKLVQCQFASDVERQETNCSLFTQINCACCFFLLVSVCDSPSQWWGDLPHSSRR